MTVRQRQTAALAATSRQVGYWIDRGWLQPVARGTGGSYQWTDAEWEVAMVMARLVTAGLAPEAAHRVARAGGVAEIGSGITVLVDQPWLSVLVDQAS